MSIRYVTFAGPISTNGDGTYKKANCFADSRGKLLETSSYIGISFLYYANTADCMYNNLDTFIDYELTYVAKSKTAESYYSSHLTLEEMTLWLDLCAAVGFKFKTSEPVEYYTTHVREIDVLLSDHYNDRNLILHTLTALRLPREFPHCARNLSELVESNGLWKSQQQAWDYFNLCIQHMPKDNVYELSTSPQYFSGHHLKSVYGDSPSSLGEVFDNFFMASAFSPNQPHVHRSWNGNPTFHNGFGEYREFLSKARELKEKYNGVA